MKLLLALFLGLSFSAHSKTASDVCRSGFLAGSEATEVFRNKLQKEAVELARKTFQDIQVKEKGRIKNARILLNRDQSNYQPFEIELSEERSLQGDQDAVNFDLVFGGERKETTIVGKLFAEIEGFEDQREFDIHVKVVPSDESRAGTLTYSVNAEYRHDEIGELIDGKAFCGLSMNETELKFDVEIVSSFSIVWGVEKSLTEGILGQTELYIRPSYLDAEEAARREQAEANRQNTRHGRRKR